MEIESQTASVGAEERKRTDDVAQKTKKYKEDPDLKEVVEKLKVELDGLRKQIMEAKPIDINVRMASSEVQAD